MLNLIIFGAPGSGKGTQSERVATHYGLEHISTGDLLRKEAKSGTERGEEIEALISKGQFVSDEMILDILLNYIDGREEQRGLILDGFPRTVSQAKQFLERLEQTKRTRPILVTLEVDDEELRRRLLERGKVSGRSDDNEETINKRIQIYHETTQPVIDYYAKEGYCCMVDGTGDVAEITDRIIEAVDRIVAAQDRSF